MSVPVVVTAYNRPGALRGTLEALAANDLAAQTDLLICLDGAKGEQDRVQVEAVREVALQAHGFRRVTHSFSAENRGLAATVIRGVNLVLETSDAVIVVEDDLITRPSFLRFMNEGLERYRDVPDVFSICGYTNQVNPSRGYAADAYFAPRSSSWGWGTWRDRWQSVDWNPTPASLQKNVFAFNRWGGSDCASMLRGWMEGRNNSWAIRFCYSQFLQGKVSLFPILSLVDPSLGFDGSGTNIRRYVRFRYSMDDQPDRSFRFPPEVGTDSALVRSALRYHSLPFRLWSRLMYLVYG